MNNLDRGMEFLVAAVFILVGLSKILSYRYRKEPSNTGEPGLAIEFPYWCVALVGLFEMVAAMALVSSYELALFAAVSLALSTIIASLYRVSAEKPAAPAVILFLLVLFVFCGRTI